MKIDNSIQLHHGFTLSRSDLNAALGILGIFALGIFLNWYPLVVLKIQMPGDIIWSKAANAIFQTLTTIVIPYTWAMTRLGLSLPDLGISMRNLGKTLILGCMLYAIALAAFIHCTADPMISNHIVGKLPPWEAVGMVSSMALNAAGTDFATRGFILLALVRHTHVSIAIIIQNLVWYLGHIPEINMLTACLGLTGALGLTITLGTLGDVIALKTRNVVGLAIAHILLNIILTIYIRQL